MSLSLAQGYYVHLNPYSFSNISISLYFSTFNLVILSQYRFQYEGNLGLLKGLKLQMVDLLAQSQIHLLFDCHQGYPPQLNPNFWNYLQTTFGFCSIFAFEMTCCHRLSLPLIWALQMITLAIFVFIQAYLMRHLKYLNF